MVSDACHGQSGRTVEIWHDRESNAIIYYLIEKYDTGHKISAATFDEKVIQQQWLYFQASGQG